MLRSDLLRVGLCLGPNLIIVIHFELIKQILPFILSVMNHETESSGRSSLVCSEGFPPVYKHYMRDGPRA